MSRTVQNGPVFVVSVDASPTSPHVSAYATGMAQRLQARLIFVYVRPIGWSTHELPLAHALIDDVHREIVQDIRARICVAESMGETNVELVERVGSPIRELVGVAIQVSADAVFVGARMRVGRKMPGSLAAGLVRQARWPIVVVP